MTSPVPPPPCKICQKRNASDYVFQVCKSCKRQQEDPNVPPLCICCAVNDAVNGTDYCLADRCQVSYNWVLTHPNGIF
jgi:hypothetical protein